MRTTHARPTRQTERQTIEQSNIRARARGRRVMSASTTKAAKAAEVESPWLDTEGAAAYLGSTRNTLTAWRARGRGPKFHNIRSRMIRYHRDDLDDFMRSGGAAR